MTIIKQNYAFRINTQEAKHACDYCASREGITCPIGGYKVHLKAVYIGGSKKTVCQSCLHEHFNVIASSNLNGEKKLGFWQRVTSSKFRYITDNKAAFNQR